MALQRDSTIASLIDSESRVFRGLTSRGESSIFENLEPATSLLMLKTNMISSFRVDDPMTARSRLGVVATNIRKDTIIMRSKISFKILINLQ